MSAHSRPSARSRLLDDSGGPAPGASTRGASSSGVDPHRSSATIEVGGPPGELARIARFTAEDAGYAAMRRYAKSWPST